ncbi:hypothetical protein BpHYR1_013487 [Brachionus plicatilis]|uniref:Uncharacterized protein n=1 Tax=Brachionus plicatilis TaxID=10195 RepID=A0A3M7PL11_BRAPC|nr:hypothetical protein BpHYR1_013487 [Brachionus plicatilis]
MHVHSNVTKTVGKLIIFLSAHFSNCPFSQPLLFSTSLSLFLDFRYGVPSIFYELFLVPYRVVLVTSLSDVLSWVGWIPKAPKKKKKKFKEHFLFDNNKKIIFEFNKPGYPPKPTPGFINNYFMLQFSLLKQRFSTNNIKTGKNESFMTQSL